MTALEDRIRAGLHADRDVPDLWDAVLIGAHRRRTRRTATATALVAAVVVALVMGVIRFSLGDRDTDPLPAGPPDSVLQLDSKDWDLPTAQFLDGVHPRPSDVVGLWRVRTSEDAWLMLLGRDGYWTTTNGWDLFGGGRVGNRGTWSLAGGRLTWEGKEGFLGTGWSSVQDAALFPDGSLHLVTRAAAGIESDRYVYDRVAPGRSLLMAGLVGTRGERMDAQVTNGYLPGVWISADSHWVVTIDLDHRFRAFRDNGDPSATPDDGGRVEIDPRGRVTMDCRGGTVSGDVTMMRTDAVEGLIPPGIRMRWDSVASSCASGLGGASSWIRLTERA